MEFYQWKSEEREERRSVYLNRWKTIVSCFTLDWKILWTGPVDPVRYEDSQKEILSWWGHETWHELVFVWPVWFWWEQTILQEDRLILFTRKKMKLRNRCARHVSFSPVCSCANVRIALSKQRSFKINIVIGAENSYNRRTDESNRMEILISFWTVINGGGNHSD